MSILKPKPSKKQKRKFLIHAICKAVSLSWSITVSKIGQYQKAVLNSVVLSLLVSAISSYATLDPLGQDIKILNENSSVYVKTNNVLSIFIICIGLSGLSLIGLICDVLGVHGSVMTKYQRLLTTVGFGDSN